jgi:hypothetical protein
MSTLSIIASACGSFEDFVVEADPNKVNESSHCCLMDYIAEWIISGHGVKACAGDFQTYLIAVIGIIEQWMTHPNILRFVPEDSVDPNVIPRHVASIWRDYRPGDGAKHYALDQYWFTQQVFDYCHPQQ